MMSDECIHCLYFLSSRFRDTAYDFDFQSEQINKEIRGLSSEYIWSKDKLVVYPAIFDDKRDDLPAHLFSSTCFGDNIDDEWFIIYLLLKLSEKFKYLVIQAKDNDGDFLLIEAADTLPKWMNPETTDNRVFIHQGKIHIISPDVVDLNKELKLNDAVNIVSNPAIETVATLDIQQAIVKRVSDYPDKIKDNIHRTVVKLPLDLATLLTIKPDLISSIVNAYCNHDIIDAKCCKNVELQEPILSQITFTKFLYAMLIHCKPMNTKSFLRNSRDQKYVVGLKLLCGYKILLNEANADIFDSKDFSKFIEKLQKNSYFKENIEGSKQYTTLLQTAKDYFVATYSALNKSFSHNVKQITSTEEFIKKKEVLAHQDSSLLSEDSEEWLNIDPYYLDDLLVSRYGKKIKENVSKEISDQISNFLYQSSDLEGIEINSEEVIKDDKIDFDPDYFSTALQNILNFISTDNTESIHSDGDTSSCDENIDETRVHNDTGLDKELKQSLKSDLFNANVKDDDVTYSNIVQSLKEEQGHSGPSSMLLRNIGINKNDLLDSDDEFE